MKFTVAILSVLALFASSDVFADAANVLVSFSTPGPDKYVDGTTVADGERYALVWTKGEAFAGFTTAGEAVDENQLVVFKAPLAKGGRCPLTVFQIDSARAPVGGVYSVYLLDTRGSKDQVVVTGSALAKTYKASGGYSKAVTLDEDKTVDGAGAPVALAATAVGLVDKNGLAAPVIKGFKVEGAFVKITVANVFPGFAYEVKAGATPGNRETIASRVTAKGDNTIELTVGKDDAKFFSINAR